MAIVVFDSGLGSLSIIKEIQKKTKCEIVYIADQKNFPYGKKSKLELLKIIRKTLEKINKTFKPEIIILASNTPSLLLGNKIPKNIIKVLPPLKKIANHSETNNVAILATQSVVNSITINNYIKKNVSKKIKVFKINASPLVELVESGRYITKPKHTRQIIRKTLTEIFQTNKIDVATLSSTHLPFLLNFLRREFPEIVFLNPACDVAEKVAKNLKITSRKNKITIFTTGNPKNFQNNLIRIGIKNKVNYFSL
tara:strand:- start:2237 stop:2995 length:759 start_codon:yes stop_codon:yes gene_type:complete